MRFVSPKEVQSIAVKTKLWLVDVNGKAWKGVIRSNQGSNRFEILMERQFEFRTVPWSRDTNRWIGERNSMVRIAYRDD